MIMMKTKSWEKKDRNGRSQIKILGDNENRLNDYGRIIY